MGLRCLTALVLAGCAGAAGGTDTGPSEGEPDATDRVVDDVSVRFGIELSPGASGPVWVMESDEEGQPAWIRVTRDGVRVHLLPRCEIPDCGAEASVCGAAIPTVRELGGVGDTAGIQLRWDGRGSAIDEATGCEMRRPVEPGRFLARLCYARATEPGGPGSLGRRLVDEVCVERPFVLGESEVALVID